MIAMAAFPPVSLLVTTYAIIISLVVTSVNKKVSFISNFLSLFHLPFWKKPKEKARPGKDLAICHSHEGIRAILRIEESTWKPSMSRRKAFISICRASVESRGHW